MCKIANDANLIKNRDKFHNIKLFSSSTAIIPVYNQFGLLYMTLQPGQSIPHYPVRWCSDADTRSSDKLSGIRYIFLQLPVTCILARLSSFSRPRSYRLTNGLGRGYGGRRLKSRRRGRRQDQGTERWRARRGEIKKKLRVTLCPNASFCCRTRRPADYLSRRGRACISVKSRSLHERREKKERENT